MVALYQCTESCPYFTFCVDNDNVASAKGCERRPKFDWLLTGYDNGFISIRELGKKVGSEWKVHKILQATGRSVRE